MKDRSMNLPDTTRRRHLEANSMHKPPMPRLAAHAANVLARDLFTIEHHVRAVAAWFAQNGDPFSIRSAEEFAEDVRAHEARINVARSKFSTGQLVAFIVAASAELKSRLDATAREE
jgi:hypothetical protein